jgi:hypothetical protein
MKLALRGASPLGALALAACASAPPSLPTLLHDTRVALSQADMASALVAFGEYCEDRPFTVYRTTALKIHAQVRAAAPTGQGGSTVRPPDSISPAPGHAVASHLVVDLDQERVDPSELRRTLARYTELCKHLSVGDDRFPLKTGGIQAQGPNGRWYAAEDVLARKMTEIFWEVLWRHPQAGPGGAASEEQLPPIPPHIDPIDLPPKVPRVEPVD